MLFSRFRYDVVVSLTACFSLVGCTTNVVPAPFQSAVAVSGNWQIASADTSATRLPVLTGVLSGSGDAVRGVMHSRSNGDCIAPTMAVELTGSANAAYAVTLSGPLAGGTLKIAGTLSADGQSLRDATYTVVGGSCAFAAPAAAIANAYSSITGNYTGGFSDANGQVIAIAATLTQNPASDANGNFQLSGTATFPNNPCFNSPVTIASSQVTGGNFSLTYTDSVTTNSVTANGTFSTDGLTLTAANWALTGPCGPDSGTGSLTRH